MISGYSLTEEKCTVREPQPAWEQKRYALVFFSLQTSMSQVLHPLFFFSYYLHGPQVPDHHPIWTRHPVALQNMAVAFNGHMAMIKNTRSEYLKVI